ERFYAYLDEHETELRTRLQSVGLVRDNGTKDTKAAMELMRHSPVVSYTPTGRVKVGKDECEKSGNPHLVAYAEFTSIASLRKKTENLRKALIQPRFTPMVATGRTSCSDNSLTDSFQLQNLPRNGPIRECFRARDGYLLADADVSGLEM